MQSTPPRSWRCLALLLLLLPACVLAQTVRVCSHPLPPHSMPDAQGEPDGYATRVLQGVAAQLGWQLDFRYMPWLRLVADAKAGECDILYTVLKRSDYEAFLNYPRTPVQLRANVLIVRRDSGIRYDGDIEAFMRRYSVGLYRDKAVDERFQTLRRQPWARVDETATPHQNMQKLLAGRFDAAIENNLTAVDELRQLGQLDAVEILQPPINVTEAYIAFPKTGKLHDGPQQFDDAFARFSRSAEFKAINRRYEGRH